MNRKALCTFFLVIALCFPSAALAQFDSGFRPREFSVGGSGWSDKNFDTTTFSTEMTLGYYMNDRFELMIRQGIGVSDTEDGSKWSGATRSAADFHLDFDWCQPYLGGLLGYVYGEGLDGTWVAGPEGGMKLYINSTTFVNLYMAYEFMFDDADDARDDFKDGRFVYGISMGVRF